jgi:hypothetical protein
VEAEVEHLASTNLPNSSGLVIEDETTLDYTVRRNNGNIVATDLTA